MPSRPIDKSATRTQWDMGEVAPRTLPYVHVCPRPGFRADLLLAWVVGERHAKLPVDLGLVGRVGTGQDADQIAER